MAFDLKKQSKVKTVGIVVVCLVLALSMTIPSVALLLSKDDSSSSSSASATTTATTTMLSISEGYVASFEDLKTAQSESQTPESYDETFQETYDYWAYSLYGYAAQYDLTSADEVSQSFTLLLDSLKATQSASADPDAYNTYFAYAYYAYTYALMSCEKTTGEDLSTQLAVCFTEGVNYHQSALTYEYTPDTAGDLATLYYWNGDIDEAITTAKAALEQYPDYAVCWYNLGNYYFTSGQYELAQDAYNEALTVDPDDEYGVATYANTQIENLKDYL